MAVLSVPRVLIGGINKGCGKSFITAAILLTLKKRKVSVAYATTHTNFYNTSFIRRVIDRFAYTSDPEILTVQQILLNFKNAANGSDFLVIDGYKGIYDCSSPGTFKGSDAFIAGLSHTPLYCVADVRQFEAGFGALIKGYKEASNIFDYAGTIGNFFLTGDDGTEYKDRVFYDCALELFGMDPLIGNLPHIHDQPYGQHTDFSQHIEPPYFSRQFLYDLADLAEKNIDLDKLLTTGEQSPELEIPLTEQFYSRKAKIAYANDNAFACGFQENVDILAQSGAEIVVFSPLFEEELPENISAIYIPGCYLNYYAKDLSANAAIKQAIKNFYDNGGIIMSEGAGTAYLCDTFTFPSEDGVFEGVGIIQGHAIANSECIVTKCEVTITEDTFIGAAKTKVKGVYINDWVIEPSSRNVFKQLSLNLNGDIIKDGFSPNSQSLCSLSFLHFASNPQLAKNFVDAAEAAAN